VAAEEAAAEDFPDVESSGPGVEVLAVLAVLAAGLLVDAWFAE
jgi:hypothetical protein